MDSGCSWRVFNLMDFHPLALCRKFSIQHREEGRVWIDGVRCCALLLQPGADYLWVGLHAGLFVRDDKHLIRDEVGPVLSGLALEVAEVHDSTHIHVPEVVPASTRQHLQRCNGEVGGGTTLSEPVGGPADGRRRANVKEKNGLEYHRCLHDGCVRKGYSDWLLDQKSGSSSLVHLIVWQTRGTG